MLSKDQTQCHHVATLPESVSPFSDTTTKVIIYSDKIVFKVVIISFECSFHRLVYGFCLKCHVTFSYEMAFLGYFVIFGSCLYNSMPIIVLSTMLHFSFDNEPV